MARGETELWLFWWYGAAIWQYLSAVVDVVQGSSTTVATQQTFLQTVTTTDIKQTCVIYIHLFSRCNNEIWRIPPPHISSSEEILLCLTHRTLVQLRTNKWPFLKSYLHKVDAKLHPSPLCSLCNTHIHNTHHLFNCTHIRTTLSPLEMWTDPAGETARLARRTEKLAGGPQAGRSDSHPLEWVDNNNNL